MYRIQFVYITQVLHVLLLKNKKINSLFIKDNTNVIIVSDF